MVWIVRPRDQGKKRPPRYLRILIVSCDDAKVNLSCEIHGRCEAPSPKVGRPARLEPSPSSAFSRNSPEPFRSGLRSQSFDLF